MSAISIVGLYSLAGITINVCYVTLPYAYCSVETDHIHDILLAGTMDCVYPDAFLWILLGFFSFILSETNE